MQILDFIKKDHIIEHKQVTAEEIWRRDAEKDSLCISKGIMLVRVKEYDWEKFNNIEKERIKNIIENQKNELSLQNE